MEVSAPVFHPAKKRKFLRARHTDSEERNTEATGDSSSQIGSWPPSAARSPGENEEQDDGDGAPISDIIRLRKSQKSRRAGIGFSANDKSSGGQQSSALVPAEQDVEKHQILGMEDRFTGHTGQKVDVDKHMMAYIDSEMAKRQVQSDPDGCAETTVDGDGNVQRMAEVHLPQRQPASLGKLHEIDLGPDAKLRNIQRTEAATRILAGRESPTPSDGELPPRKGDGKPWRGRKRRNSDDIRRDQLVEEVLRESKLDVYEEAEEPQGEDGQAADDRIAEQFKRDFLDAIQARRRGARAKTTTTTTKGGKPEAPRGPKLGGSRSARAAMREKQNKAGQK